MRFGIGRDGVYTIPGDELVGGDEWRHARVAEYDEQLAVLHR